MTIVSDITKLQVEMERLAAMAVSNQASIARQEEQINGDRGLSASINSLGEEFRGLRRALWSVGASIVVSAIGFGLSILLLVH